MHYRTNNHYFCRTTFGYGRGESISCGNEEGMLGNEGYWQCESCLEREEKKKNYNEVCVPDQLQPYERMDRKIGSEYLIHESLISYENTTYAGTATDGTQVVIILENQVIDVDIECENIQSLNSDGVIQVIKHFVPQEKYYKDCYCIIVPRLPNLANTYIPDRYGADKNQVDEQIVRKVALQAAQSYLKMQMNGIAPPHKPTPQYIYIKEDGNFCVATRCARYLSIDGSYRGARFDDDCYIGLSTIGSFGATLLQLVTLCSADTICQQKYIGAQIKKFIMEQNQGKKLQYSQELIDMIVGLWDEKLSFQDVVTTLGSVNGVRRVDNFSDTSIVCSE
ncbi:intermediate capsid protein VP6 [Acrasis kona]|uniref:Intermediate capsid protein VP6 n=1 Tax=Acrasis kona TaxID=1008807 RepID=A0AAW2ZA54_9EUKA